MMLACAGGRNRPLALSICYSPNILTLYCRWKGRAPIGPLGEHIATTANADRASSICLEACIGANAITFLVFDKADVQVRACMCSFVRACARASGCGLVCMRTLRTMCAWRVRECACVYCYVWPHTLLCSDLLVGCRRYVRSSRKKSPNSVTRQSSRAPTQRGRTMCNM